MTIIGRYNEEVKIVKHDGQMAFVEEIDGGLIYEWPIKLLSGDRKEIKHELKATMKGN